MSTKDARIQVKRSLSYKVPRACPWVSTIVLLRKDRNKKRAEGILVRLEETGKYVNGVQRYNVHIKGLTEVTFKKENFNYNGVALIEGDC